MVPKYTCDFEAVLFRTPGKGGWVFAPVPDEMAPAVTVGWGRTPVRATVEGHTWATSVWRDKRGRTLLAVPQKVRGPRDHDDIVHVRLEYSIEFRA